MSEKNINDYIILLASSVAAILVGLVVYKIIQENLGSEALNQLILIQRYSGFIVPLIMFGLGTIVPIEISIARQCERANITKSAIIIIIATGAIVYIILQIAEIFISKQLLGGQKQINQLIIVSLTLSLWSVVYATRRGDGTLSGIEKFNILIIMPLTILIAQSSSNLEEYIYIISVLYAVGAILMGISKIKGKFTRFRKDIIERGKKRVKVDVLYPLITIAPIYWVSTFDKEMAALLSFSISIAGSINILISPISTLVLPMVSSNNTSNAKYLKIINWYIIILPVYLLINIPLVLIVSNIYAYKINNMVLVVTCLSAYFMGLYILLRSVIDGIYGEKVQTKIVGLALIVELLLIMISRYFEIAKSTDVIVFSYLIGTGVLAVVSYIKAKEIS